MEKPIDYSNLTVALQSVDFCTANYDFKIGSLQVVPFGPSWSPKNLSYAAYSIKDTAEAIENNQLQIQARFVSSKKDLFFKIRVSNFIPQSQSTIDQISHTLYESHNILGEVEATNVYFSDSGQSMKGTDSNIPLTISGAKFEELGVGVYDIFWKWEYQELFIEADGSLSPVTDDWTGFETSTHRVFVTLEEPQRPWTARPFIDLFKGDFSKTPVWTEALLWACKWAQGSKTIEDAAKKIADKLFHSGEFKYTSNSLYGLEKAPIEYKKLKLDDNTSYFYLSKVIERLEGGEGRGDLINCVDCSLIVATLTNILGGKMQIGRLQGTAESGNSAQLTEDNRFQIKPIQSIGYGVDHTMADLVDGDSGKSFFTYHAIPWLPAKEAYPEASVDKPSDEVIRERLASDDFNIEDLVTVEEPVPVFDHEENLIFDACVNFSIDGTDANLVSGAGLKLNEYRENLATECQIEGIVKCLPQQSTINNIRLV